MSRWLRDAIPITPGWWRRSRRRGRRYIGDQSGSYAPCVPWGLIAIVTRAIKVIAPATLSDPKSLRCNQDHISSGDTGDNHQDDHVCHVVLRGLMAIVTRAIRIIAPYYLCRELMAISLSKQRSQADHTSMTRMPMVIPPCCPYRINGRS